MPTLSWQTRAADIRAVGATPYHALVADDALSHGETNDKNILIQGDNLLALKSLVPHYAGAVKCVFIDPPYNTRKDFEHYDDNLEHSQWLAMIRPQLDLLRRLLAEDGSIWAIIDDDEGHYLKVLMDEVFGRKNFVANVVWQKKFSPQNDEDFITSACDHIHVYAKSKKNCVFSRLPRLEHHNLIYKNPDKDPRGVWASGDMTSKTKAAGHSYPVETSAGIIHYPPAGRQWAPSLDTYRRWLAESRIWFGKGGKNRPRIKQFLSEVEKKGIVPMSLWFRDDVGDNQEAKREAMRINSRSIFDTPKPERLLMRVMHLATQPGDLTLDSFLGSGTTAAVAHKMGRRWIGIERGEHAQTHCLPRLRAVVDGGDAGGITAAANWRGGGGFRFLRLGEEIFLPSGKINPAIGFGALAGHIWFQQTATPLSLAQTRGPFLGARKGVGYALLFNGIIKDKSANGGNALVRATLARCRESAREAGFPDGGRLVIWGNSNRLRRSTLRAANVEFRQTPYEIKTK